MVKSVLSTAHQGLRDWIVQRLSALLMTAYVFIISFYAIYQHGLSFDTLHQLFDCLWMKIFTLLVLVALLWHAWIGMWTIFTDYVHSMVMRNLLCVVIYLALGAYLIWGVVIIWS